MASHLTSAPNCDPHLMYDNRPFIFSVLSMLALTEFGAVEQVEIRKSASAAIPKPLHSSRRMMPDVGTAQ